MSTPKMDADYFITKFEAIPEDGWGTGAYVNGTQCCALGWCGEREPGDPSYCKSHEADALEVILDYRTVNINDGAALDYPQRTPRARILAALRDAKKAGR